jgi:nicotinamidase-related amidase
MSHYRKLYTAADTAVVFIDHQPQMTFGVANIDRASLINNVVFLAKVAREFGVPAVLTGVETEGFSGYLWPQLLNVYPGQAVVERSSMNAWDDAAFRAAIEATGRKNILLTGLWTEVCVAWPCIEMMAAGYNIYVVEDCCGATSVLAHDAALSRMVQAGAIRLTTIAALLEWQRDWARKEHYGPLMDIIKEHGGAYGAGVEYAYTMVHKAPQSAHKSPRRRLEALICVSGSTPPISTESRRAHSPCHHATRPARIRSRIRACHPRLFPDVVWPRYAGGALGLAFAGLGFSGVRHPAQLRQ